MVILFYSILSISIGNHIIISIYNLDKLKHSHTIHCSLLSPTVHLCPSPDNADLMVDCGTNMIILEINLCTAQWAGFNPSGLALNGEHNKTECQGTIDTSVDPPIIRYQLPVNHSQENPCRQSLQVRHCAVKD